MAVFLLPVVLLLLTYPLYWCRVSTNAAELHTKDGVLSVEQSPSKAVLDENG